MDGLERKRRGATALTDEQVREVRALVRRGVNRLDIARAFGVGKETISRIVRGDTYFWVKDNEHVEG